MDKAKKIIIVAVFLIVFIFIISHFFIKKTSTTKSVSTSAGPQKTQILNKDFSFPVTAVDGSPASLKFTVQDASIDNQIVVQGQNATAVAGRTFLIVTLKLTNSLNQSININTRNYVRLSVNGDQNTWLAPDIHNDPVEVQAISTKFTRVGFAINTTDKNFVLQIGEIKGDKQKIELNL